MYLAYILTALALFWCVLCMVYEYQANEDFRDYLKSKIFNIKMWYRLNYIKVNIKDK